MVAARFGGAAPALGLGEFFIDLVLGAVLFVVVIAVTAVVMSILQAVLPHGDTEADALAAADPGEDDRAGSGPSALSTGSLTASDDASDGAS